MVSRSRQNQGQEASGMLGASDLMERLLHVRKRKRAFGGQTVDMEAIRRRLEAEQKGKRGR
jgi:hypothetical protein